MDAFYASVEQLDNPKLRGLPIAVGGGEKRGVVAAASYEARKYGVKSSISGLAAKSMCSNIIFVKPRHDRYRYISNQIKDIFYDYTDLVEPISLDEAFLDVTINKKNIIHASDVALEIRKRIKNEIGITASAGISINKFIAKVASDINKPNGQKTVHPDQVKSFLNNLPIHKFYGIGKVTEKKMNSINVYFGKDLRKIKIDLLIKKFGKSGINFFKIIRCIQNDPVIPNRKRKSIGVEKSFLKNLISEISMIEKLEDISLELERRLKKNFNKGRTVTIKIKTNDYRVQTRSLTVGYYLNDKADFYPIIKELFYKKKICKPVRLLGIAISNLYNEKHYKKIDLDSQLRFKF